MKPKKMVGELTPAERECFITGDGIINLPITGSCKSAENLQLMIRPTEMGRLKNMA